MGCLKDETKDNSIVEFIGIRPKMYSFIVLDASEPILGVNYPINIRHKAVAKSWRAPRSSALSTKITCACSMVES